MCHACLNDRLRRKVNADGHWGELFLLIVLFGSDISALLAKRQTTGPIVSADSFDLDIILT